MLSLANRCLQKNEPPTMKINPVETFHNIPCPIQHYPTKKISTLFGKNTVDTADTREPAGLNYIT